MANIKISELPEADLPLDGTEDIVIVQDGATKRCSTDDVANLAVPFRTLTFKLTQAGTAAPTAVWLDNTTGLANPTFTREAAGFYHIIAPSALFVAAKLFLPNNYFPYNGSFANLGDVVKIARVSDTDLSIATPFGGTPTDGLLTDVPFEIRIYN